MSRRSRRKLDVVLKPAAIRDLRKLEKRDQRRIGEKIDALSTDPRPHGVEALKGKGGFLRARVGNFRIIYLLDDEAREIVIARVRHRRNAYRKM